jgi:2-methylcitrate dehydratase PrpD
MENTYTKQLAGFCAGLEFASIPKPVIDKTKWAILDNLGVILGASVTQEGRDLADYVKDLGDREEATALGFGFKSSTRNAAFLNGSLSEMLELQDGYTKGGVHACCGVISAALATAEYARKGGRELLESIVVGYEVTDRVAEVVHPSHLGRGFQPTGTAGAIGAAAAVGKLLGFDDARMFNAIGISGFILPVSTGDNLWGGYTIKPVHGGAAAKAGIEAALLAEKGLTACSLEGDPKLNKGFCVIVSDKPNFAKMIEDLGERYTIDEVYFKPYACCRINHAAVEIILDLTERHHLGFEEIESIVIRTYNFAASVPGRIRTHPGANFLHCQFSMSYCAAVALMDGRVGLEQFQPKRIQDPKVHQLADRIQIVADEEMEGLRPANRPANVEITLKNGEKVTGRVHYPKGDPRKPMTEEELLSKYETLASHALAQGHVEELRAGLFELENVSDVGELIKFCSKS